MTTVRTSTATRWTTRNTNLSNRKCLSYKYQSRVIKKLQSESNRLGSSSHHRGRRLDAEDASQDATHKSRSPDHLLLSAAKRVISKSSTVQIFF